MSNVPPALALVVLAFAYLEEDGALLCAAFLVIWTLLAGAAGIVWHASNAARWMAGLF